MNSYQISVDKSALLCTMIYDTPYILMSCLSLDNQTYITLYCTNKTPGESTNNLLIVSHNCGIYWQEIPWTANGAQVIHCTTSCNYQRSVVASVVSCANICPTYYLGWVKSCQIYVVQFVHSLSFFYNNLLCKKGVF